MITRTYHIWWLNGNAQILHIGYLTEVDDEVVQRFVNNPARVPGLGTTYEFGDFDMDTAFASVGSDSPYPRGAP